jgi:DNA repair ATPase RecN
MTISELAVESFQSLYDVKIPLGKLTVVVGHSNSGKSAFGRALKAVSRNSISPGYVSKGKTSAKLRLTYSDGTAVELERGKGVSSYKLVNEHGHSELYAKCGTTVPADVQKVLKTPEGDPDLFFSTQFDSPWLLAETGSATAKVLGDLTNVSMLAEAAREANRRRQEMLKLAGIRRKDADAAVTRVKTEYADLGTRKKAVEEARELLSAAIDASSRITQLEDLSGRYTSAQRLIVSAQAKADELTSLLKSVAGDMQDLEEVEAKINEVESWAKRYNAQVAFRAEKEREINDLEIHIQEAEQELHETLKEAGTCPLCQQTIK